MRMQPTIQYPSRSYPRSSKTSLDNRASTNPTAEFNKPSWTRKYSSANVSPHVNPVWIMVPTDLALTLLSMYLSQHVTHRRIMGNLFRRYANEGMYFGQTLATIINPFLHVLDSISLPTTAIHDGWVTAGDNTTNRSTIHRSINNNWYDGTANPFCREDQHHNQLIGAMKWCLTSQRGEQNTSTAK
ncbi:hypothetical protein Hypma_000381 [Hypsizygus marmoreus]|uniref:Uncharacterized protein n=1 Tax=Hypsizygus marmoreus TaxID=39966 RepID=A0A369JAY0_HYPMA|nr:hypothetical protein Hypma_000381 [Hypsizygus marmoreus]